MEKLRGAERPGSDAPRQNTASYSRAIHLSTSFIGGIAVGAVIGYGFDQLFGTMPFGLVFFLLAGFAAGTLNVLRDAKRAEAKPVSQDLSKSEDLD